MAPSPILVVGKNGQLARCLADRSTRKNPATAMGRPDLDLETPDSIQHAIDALRPRAIINAAAYTAVDRAETEPDRAFAINRDGAERLAAAAARLSIPFIHVSTDYVFDGSREGSYGEDDPTAPVSVYGRSKRDGERAVQQACPDALIIRTAWVYSPHGQNFVKTMLRLAATRDVVRVVDDQRGSPTSADDLAAALLQLVEQVKNGASATAGIYHLTGAGATTWHDFAAAVFDGWQRRRRTVPKLEAIATAEYPTLAARPRNSQLDCSKIERRFGIRLPQWRQSLEACLDKLIAKDPVRA